MIPGHDKYSELFDQTDHQEEYDKFSLADRRGYWEYNFRKNFLEDLGLGLENISQEELYRLAGKISLSDVSNDSKRLIDYNYNPFEREATDDDVANGLADTKGETIIRPTVGEVRDLVLSDLGVDEADLNIDVERHDSGKPKWIAFEKDLTSPKYNGGALFQNKEFLSWLGTHKDRPLTKEFADANGINWPQTSTNSYNYWRMVEHWGDFVAEKSNASLKSAIGHTDHGDIVTLPEGNFVHIDGEGLVRTADSIRGTDGNYTYLGYEYSNKGFGYGFARTSGDMNLNISADDLANIRVAEKAFDDKVFTDFISKHFNTDDFGATEVGGNEDFGWHRPRGWVGELPSDDGLGELVILDSSRDISYTPGDPSDQHYAGLDITDDGVLVLDGNPIEMDDVAEIVHANDHGYVRNHAGDYVRRASNKWEYSENLGWYFPTDSGWINFSEEGADSPGKWGYYDANQPNPEKGDYYYFQDSTDPSKGSYLFKPAPGYLESWDNNDTAYKSRMWVKPDGTHVQTAAAGNQAVDFAKLTPAELWALSPEGKAEAENQAVDPTGSETVDPTGSEAVEIPADFDPYAYVNHPDNADLHEAFGNLPYEEIPDAARNHWLEFGFEEGRPYRPEDVVAKVDAAVTKAEAAEAARLEQAAEAARLEQAAEATRLEQAAEAEARLAEAEAAANAVEEWTLPEAHEGGYVPGEVTFHNGQYWVNDSAENNELEPSLENGWRQLSPDEIISEVGNQTEGFKPVTPAFMGFTGDEGYTAAYNQAIEFARQNPIDEDTGRPAEWNRSILSKIWDKLDRGSNPFRWLDDFMGGNENLDRKIAFDAAWDEQADHQAYKTRMANIAYEVQLGGGPWADPSADPISQALEYLQPYYARDENGNIKYDENGEPERNPDWIEGNSIYGIDEHGNERSWSPSGWLPFDFKEHEWRLRDALKTEGDKYLDMFTKVGSDGYTHNERNYHANKKFMTDAGILNEDPTKSLLGKASVDAANYIYGDKDTPGSLAHLNDQYIGARKYYDQNLADMEDANWRDKQRRRAPFINATADTSYLRDARTRSGERIGRAKFFGGSMSPSDFSNSQGGLKTSLNLPATSSYSDGTNTIFGNLEPTKPSFAGLPATNMFSKTGASATQAAAADPNAFGPKNMFMPQANSNPSGFGTSAFSTEGYSPGVRADLAQKSNNLMKLR